MFAKDFRLKVMKKWDDDTFNKYLGNDVSYGVVLGRSLSGKTEISQNLSQMVGGKIISLGAVQDQVKKSMGTDEEPYEGEVSKDKVYEAVLKLISNDRSTNKKFTYIFDGYSHSA